MGFLGFSAIAVLLWYTGHEVIAGRLSIGTLDRLPALRRHDRREPRDDRRACTASSARAPGAVQRVFEIIDTQPTINDAPDAWTLGPITGRIELEGVTFAYDGARAVLRDVDLDVPAGEVLALVGPSGSGKTTLVGLIPRLWDVTRGPIRVDGTDVRDVTTASLRAQIGLVPQEATLFGGTVRENIRYGRLDATEDEVVAAARAANAHDFITALEHGLRHAGGRPRPAALRRAAAADRDRAGDPQGPADPHPRRGDERRSTTSRSGSSRRRSTG